MAAIMPTLNGTQSPPHNSPLPSTAKRKRTEPDSQPRSPTSSPSTKAVNGVHRDVSQDLKTKDTVRNIWRVLESHDTSPSVLQHHIQISSDRNLTKSEEPSSKRTKLATSAVNDTITAKLLHGSYASVEQFQFDIDAVCSELVSEAKAKGNGVHGDSTPNQPRQDRLIAELNAFRSFADSLARRESIRQRINPTTVSLSDGRTSSEEPVINGVHKMESADELDDDSKPIRTVLTLFGHAQGHKQLFSSYQKVLPKGETGKTEHIDGSLVNASIKPVLPLRENALPNGISSTKILSAPTDETAIRAKPNTFLDTFPPPASLPTLIPPKTPRPPTSRQSTITWTHNHGPVPRNSLIYAQQRLSTGHWLGYDGVALTQEPSSPEVKRRQRDRTLSTGETSSVLSDATIAAQSHAKEEALFRSLYSSFAPCRDNSLAVFPEETKSQLWWQRVGRDYLDQAFTPAAAATTPEQTAVPEQVSKDDEEEAFRKAVESFEPPEYQPEQTPDGAAPEDKSGEDLLRDISELLETLHSHQRIRNSFLNAAVRPSVRQISGLHDLIGTPSTPSTVETETYNALKAQLILIVSMLPPHAVAKLNGEQLEELNICLRIRLEEPTYRGVMEEDQAYRAAKTAAHSVPVGPGPLQSRPNVMSTPTSLMPGQARTAQMTAQSRSSIPPQYYSGAPASLTRHSSSFSRQPLSSWTTPTQNYNAMGQQRSSSTNQPNFGMQQTRPAPPSARPSMQQIPSARPPTQQPNGLYAAGTPSQPAYQQRAQSYTANSSFNVKSPYTAPQQTTPSHNSLSSPQPGQPQYMRPGYQPSKPPQPQFPAPAAPSPQGTTGIASRPQTPASVVANASHLSVGPAVQMKQSQSPAPPQAAALIARSASGTPQPKQEGQAA